MSRLAKVMDGGAKARCYLGRAVPPWSRWTVALGCSCLVACGTERLDLQPSEGSSTTGEDTGAQSDGPLIDPTGGLTLATSTGSGSGGSDDSDPSTTGPDPTGDSSTDGGSTGSPGTTTGMAGSESSGEAAADCDPLLVEVVYDVEGGDDSLEWVRLHNPCPDPIDLADYSLGWGGENYLYGLLDLEGMLAPDACTAVGGPIASDINGNPSLGQAVNLEPDLQNSGSTADGIALFLGASSDVALGTVPVDAVIYGSLNDNGLLDRDGMTPPPHVADAPSGSALVRTSPDATWVVAPPNPGACPPY